MDTTSESVLIYRRTSMRVDVDGELEVPAGQRLRWPLLPGLELRVAELFG